MIFLYVIVIIFALISLLRFPINKKRIGACIGQDGDELPLNWQDYIGIGLIILSIIQFIGGSRSFITYLLMGLAISSQRISMRLHTANGGLYEKGLILSRGVMTWNKIHSIKIINDHKAEILTMKGYAFDISTSYDINLLIEIFNKVKVEEN